MFRALATVVLPVSLTACACPSRPETHPAFADTGVDPVLAEVRRIAPDAAAWGSASGWFFIVPTDEQKRAIKARFPNVSVMSTQSRE